MARIKNHEHWIADREELAQHMRDVRETRMRPIRMKRWLINRMANLKTKEDVEKFELKPLDIMDWEHSSFTDKSLVRQILKIIDMRNPDALQNFQDSEVKKKAKKKAKKKEKDRIHAEYEKYEKKVMPFRKRGGEIREKRLKRVEEARDILLRPKAIDNKQEALEERIRKAGLVKKTWKRGDLYNKVNAYRAGRQIWNRVLRILEVNGILERSSEKGRKNETITFL